MAVIIMMITVSQHCAKLLLLFFFFLPLILTVGEFGPADCFLHPLQFWHRLSASDMKEHRESSSKRSESSKENLSPSSHSANMSSITVAGGQGAPKCRTSLATGERRQLTADGKSAGRVHGRKQKHTHFDQSTGGMGTEVNQNTARSESILPKFQPGALESMGDPTEFWYSGKSGPC